MNLAYPQILILQDLGVKSEIINQKLADLNINHQLVHTLNDSILNHKVVEIIITIKEKVDKALISKFPKLKLVTVAFTGYDVVDVNYCYSNNIAVCNVPSYATNAVAELTLGFAISLLRDIPQTSNLLQKGGWNFKPGMDLYGKNVGIIGTGAIGTKVAQLFKAFGCEIFGWSRSENQEFIKLGGIYLNNLDDLCALADIITVHTPLNNQTNNLINDALFKLMKPSAFLINTSRGPIVNEDALIKAIENDTIAGAALDVFEIEPIPHNSKILNTKNVLLTPHIAYKTDEAMEKRAIITIENIANFLRGTPKNLVTK
ncbi:MAG: hydroxyacid dehydrogenase [Bacteroidetes bacterium]|nr:hydroxyacid dehydrogenase [Bacteroidota bacterium]